MSLARATNTAIAGLVALTAQAQAQDLSDGGLYERVDIAGFLIPVRDTQQLLGAGVMVLNPERQSFAFGAGVTSEKALRRQLAGLTLEDPRAVSELYRAFKVPLPNGAAHTLTIPSGYGPARFAASDHKVSIGIGIGGVSRVPYTEEPDGGIGLSVGFGNAFNGIGVTVAMSMNDLSDLGNSDRVSWGVEFSRYIGDGLSLALGGENLFVGETDGQASFYLVGSWAFDKKASALPFDGVATLGIGSGRFADKTPRDTFEGKGEHATAIFGALAWVVSDNFNVIADWNGRNLSAGIAARLPNTPFSVKLGLRDLTGFTGDGPRFTGSVGMTLARF